MEKLGTACKKVVTSYTIIVFDVLALLFGAIFVPHFFSLYNVQNLCLQLADLLIIACGFTFIELNASTDLSVTSVLAVSSVIGGWFMAMSPLASNPVLATIVAIIVMLLVGLLFGVINALSVTVLKMPSFIVTMATMLIGQAYAVWFAATTFGKNSIGGLPKEYTAIGGIGKYFFIPILITAVMFFLADFLLKKTKFGRDLYAVGTNPSAAHISGIDVKKTIFKIFIMSGLFAAVEAIVLTARNQAGMSSLGSTMYLNIVSAVVIGGTAVSGGFGGVRQTLLGAVFIVLINNAMNLMGVEWQTIMLIQGILILVATVIDYLVKNARYKVRRQKAK